MRMMATVGDHRFASSALKAGAVFGEQRQVLFAKLDDVFTRGLVQSVAGAL